MMPTALVLYFYTVSVQIWKWLFSFFLHIIFKKSLLIFLWFLAHNNLVISHVFAGNKTELLQAKAISLNYYSY